MAGARHFFLAVVIASGFLMAGMRTGAQAPVSAVHLTPPLVEAGSPELIRVAIPGASSVEGEWLGRKIAFFHHGADWFALGGADVEAPVGDSTLHITAIVDNRR